MNISKRLKLRTEYRLHRIAIVNDFNKKLLEKVINNFRKVKERGVMKITRTKLGPVEQGFDFRKWSL